MSGSYNYLVHLIGFGLVSTILFAGIVLERRFRSEKSWTNKALVGGIMRSFGMFSPLAAAILLVTGIGNIHNYFAGAPMAWYESGWLVAKIILFAIMLVNGTVFGPRLSKSRMKSVLALTENEQDTAAAEHVKSVSKQMSGFYTVQVILWLLIVYLSAFGTGKHPGLF